MSCHALRFRFVRKHNQPSHFAPCKVAQQTPNDITSLRLARYYGEQYCDADQFDDVEPDSKVPRVSIGRWHVIVPAGVQSKICTRHSATDAAAVVDAARTRACGCVRARTRWWTSSRRRCALRRSPRPHPPVHDRSTSPSLLSFNATNVSPIPREYPSRQYVPSRQCIALRAVVVEGVVTASGALRTF